MARRQLFDDDLKRCTDVDGGPTSLGNTWTAGPAKSVYQVSSRLEAYPYPLEVDDGRLVLTRYATVYDPVLTSGGWEFRSAATCRHTRQCVGSTKTGRPVLASTHPACVRRQGKTSA
jgi:hypothetical protein